MKNEAFFFPTIFFSSPCSSVTAAAAKSILRKELIALPMLN